MGTGDKPKRLPLVATPENRNTTTDKDAQLINAFAEKSVEGDYWIYKRPGLTLSQTYSGAGAGIYNWKNNIYSVFGGSFLKNGSSLGSVNTSNGKYAFNQILSSTPKVFLMNGVAAYYSDGSSLTQITDVNYPSSLVKGSAYLDGTLYVMDANAKIYGSDLNDLSTWDPLNVIVAQIEPDGGVAIAKQASYVIAFKEWTTEFFWDAASPEGSPLASAPNLKINWGCASADSVQDIEGDLFWLGNNKSAELVIMTLSNASAQKISYPAIERLLAGADTSQIMSWQHKEYGHKFYVLTMVSKNLTLVYDIDQQLWYRWANTLNSYLHVIDSTYDAQQNHYLQHPTNGEIYLMSKDYTSDFDLPFSVDVYTPNYDGGTTKMKFVQGIEIIGDQEYGSILKVRVSDDDYRTWSSFRSIDLGKKRPRITNCGSFSRRAYHFHSLSGGDLHIKAVDLDMDIGTF